MNLSEGKKAPLFSLPASNGKTVSLKDYQGKNKVLVYFYPKDDTPGCTTEACGFRDKFDAFIKKDTIILGISPDPIKKHEKFIQKYELPFLLLSDEDKSICKKYGVWVQKKMYGREYMGVARQTFLINQEGRIEKIFEKVKPKIHTDEVLDILQTN